MSDTGGGGFEGPAVGADLFCKLGENARDLRHFLFGKLDEAIIQINGFERLDENSGAGGAGGVHDTGNRAAIGGANGNDEALVAQGDVILAGRLSAGAQNGIERFLDFASRLSDAGADAFQMRRRVVANFTVGEHGAANGGEQVAEIGKGCGAFRETRVVCSLAFERLAHRVDGVHQGGDVEQFSTREDGRRNAEPCEPLLGVGERAETEFGAGAEIGDGFADECEFVIECGNVLRGRERKDGAPPRGTGGKAADDFFQPVEFEDLFCVTGHEGLKIEL